VLNVKKSWDGMRLNVLVSSIIQGNIGIGRMVIATGPINLELLVLYMVLFHQKYPFEAEREALINSICYREYFFSG
jgi:hypothetical protein